MKLDNCKSWVLGTQIWSKKSSFLQLKFAASISTQTSFSIWTSTDHWVEAQFNSPLWFGSFEPFCSFVSELRIHVAVFHNTLSNSAALKIDDEFMARLKISWIHEFTYRVHWLNANDHHSQLWVYLALSYNDRTTRLRLRRSISLSLSTGFSQVDNS